MINKNIKLNEVMIKLLWINYILFILSEPLKFPDSLSRIISYLTILITWSLFFFAIFDKKLKFKELKMLIILLIIIIFCLISVFYTYQNITINYLLKFINFLCVLFTWFWSIKIVVNKNIINFILNGNYVVSVILILLSIINPLNVYGQLSLGFSNANTTSIILFYVWIFNLLQIKIKKKNKMLKLINNYFFILIIFTKSRTIIITLIIFLLFYIIKNQKIRNIIFSKKTIFLCIIFPLIFCYTYIYAYIYELIPRNLVFLNKPFFSQRETMWINTINGIEKNYILGNYKNYHNSMLHNSHFDIIIQYGIIVIILVIIYLFIYLNYLLKGDKKNIIYQIAYISLLISFYIGTTESVILDGGLGVYNFVGCLILITKVYKNEGEKI